MPLDTSTVNSLIQKHPTKHPANSDALLKGEAERIHPIKFASIDEELIRKVAMKTKGGSGPSGLDAEGWRRLLVSNNFKSVGCDLRKAFAAVVKKLCTEEIRDSTIESFLACRLIPLDKNPGLRPIGVGEVLRRIAGKVIVSVLKKDIVTSVGFLQVCAGQEAGSEAAIHAMNTIFEEENTEAALLVDADNAFNSINREVFLHNISILCPSISTYVRNCYLIPSRLFVIGGQEIKSQEGTTQGDPIAMAVYAIGIIPLLLMLVETVVGVSENNVKMVAFADDFSAAGSITYLRLWWDSLVTLGPMFGYFPNATKSCLITKECVYEKAKQVFSESDVHITNAGKRHLGAALGTQQYRENFINEKIQIWIKEITLLSQIAKIEPQAAYSAFISGYKHKITYFIRTLPNISQHMKQLDRVLTEDFIPAITDGHRCSATDRTLLSLPPKLGGLGIPEFVKIADMEYSNSRRITEELTNHIINQNKDYKMDPEKMQPIKNEIKLKRNLYHQKLLEDIRAKMSKEETRLNDINQELGASSWLTTLPIKDEGFTLNKQEFWDLIRLRYGWYLSRMPQICTCGSRFDVHHALICKKGGFITLRHNKIRNLTANLLSKVCKDTRVEPQLQKLSGEVLHERTANRSDEARLDISARGFWTTGQVAFFDVRVFYPNAKRHVSQSLTQCYVANETEKKRMYNSRVMEVEHGTFTPLVFSTNGGMSRECRKFYSRLAELISEKKQQNYALTISWLMRNLVFSLLKSVIICIRGSRSLNERNCSLESVEEDAEYTESIANIN